MFHHKEWYFYHYEIIVPDPKGRSSIIQRLTHIADIDGDPTPMQDPTLITASFKVVDQSKVTSKTKELKTVFNTCTIVECQGYKDKKSTQQKNLEKQKRDKRNKSLVSAVSIYLVAMFGGGSITGLFNELTLKTIPSFDIWADAFFKGAMVALPPSLVVYFKKFNQ